MENDIVHEMFENKALLMIQKLDGSNMYNVAYEQS